MNQLVDKCIDNFLVISTFYLSRGCSTVRASCSSQTVSVIKHFFQFRYMFLQPSSFFAWQASRNQIATANLLKLISFPMELNRD